MNRIINCNWKVCMEGFLESLHVLATQPQVATMVADSSAQYDVYPNEPHFSRYHALTGIASSMTHNVPTDQEILDSFTASYLPEHRNTDFGKLREGETARMALGRLYLIQLCTAFVPLIAIRIGAFGRRCSFCRLRATDRRRARSSTWVLTRVLRTTMRWARSTKFSSRMQFNFRSCNE